MKRNITKRIFMILLSACLLCGSVCTAAQVTAITAEAATSKSTVKKKAKAIVDKQVKKSDSKSKKLKKLFTYMEKKYAFQSLVRSNYINKWTKKKNYTGWDRDFAYEMYKNKKGSCYHYAAAYAYLAKKATNYPVRIALGKTCGFDKKKKNYQDHAWVEIKISGKWYIFDPNMDKQMEKSALTYYKKARSDKKIKKIYNNYKNTKYVNITL